MHEAANAPRVVTCQDEARKPAHDVRARRDDQRGERENGHEDVSSHKHRWCTNSTASTSGGERSAQAFPASALLLAR